jgi:hypothetical protein
MCRHFDPIEEAPIEFGGGISGSEAWGVTTRPILHYGRDCKLFVHSYWAWSTQELRLVHAHILFLDRLRYGKCGGD